MAGAKDKDQGSPILVYGRPNVYGVPYGGRVDPEKIRPYRTLHIHSGLNKPVEPEVWAQVSESPKLQDLATPKEDGDVPVLQSFRKLSDIHPAQVPGFVEATGSLDALRWWRENDKRTLVQRTIDKQIEKIENRMRKHRGEKAA